MKKILIALMGLLLCGCATRGYVDQRIELVRFQNECNLKSQYADIEEQGKCLMALLDYLDAEFYCTLPQDSQISVKKKENRFMPNKPLIYPPFNGEIKANPCSGSATDATKNVEAGK